MSIQNSVSTGPEIAELVPAPTIAKEFGVARRTIGRWFVDTSLEFPQPVEINRRLYFRRADIEAWKMSRLRASIVEAA